MTRGQPTIVTREACGVRFLGVYRLQDQVRVASYAHNSSEADEAEAKSSQVLQANAAGLHPRLSVSAEAVGTIHYETDRYALYAAITKHEYPQRTAFKCIGELRSRFGEAHGEALHKAEEGGLSAAAKPVMADLCTKFADATSVDRTLGLLKQVDDVKGVMSETVTNMLATHENLEVPCMACSNMHPMHVCTCASS